LHLGEARLDVQLRDSRFGAATLVSVCLDDCQRRWLLMKSPPAVLLRGVQTGTRPRFVRS